MYFNQKLKTSLAVLTGVALLTASCTNFLDGHKKKEEIIELKNDQFTCVNEVPETLKALGNGEVETEQIQRSFGCLKEALTFFNKRTKGSYPSGYSTTDIRKFFGKYFFKENNISQDLANSLMLLKQGLFGGDSDQLTKAELDRLIGFWDLLRNEIVALNPHLKILLMQDFVKKPSQIEIENSVKQLNSSALSLLKSVDLRKSNYSITNLENLIDGFYEFTHPRSKEASIGGLRKYLPLAHSLKNALFGNPAHLVLESDWSQSVATLGQLYRIVLTIYYNKIDFDFAQKSNVDFLFNLADQFVDLINSCILIKNISSIPFELIDPILVELNKLGLLKDTVQLGTWIETYKVFIERILEGSHASHGVFALKDSHVQLLKRELTILRNQQRWIDTIFSKGGLDQPLLDPEFQNRILDPILKKSIFEDSTLISLNLDLAKANADFIRLLQKPRPVKFTSRGEMHVVYDQKSRPWTWASATRANVMHTVARGFLLGYGDLGTGALNQLAVSEQGMVLWYQDFTHLGIELKAFDPRFGNTGSRSFKEANFFTFSGNGDDRMSFEESYEFVSNLFSAGISNANRLMALMRSEGCSMKELDVFGNPFFAEGCFEKVLRQKYSEIFPNLEYQNRFVHYLTDEQWKVFYQAAMATSRVNNDFIGIKVETGDIRTLVVILHYMEALYTTFDTNQNGLLELSELRVASARFHDFIAPFVPNLPFAKDYLIQEGFVALVVTGKQDFIGFKWDDIFGLTPPVTEINILNTIAYLKNKL